MGMLFPTSFLAQITAPHTNINIITNNSSKYNAFRQLCESIDSQKSLALTQAFWDRQLQLGAFVLADNQAPMIQSAYANTARDVWYHLHSPGSELAFLYFVNPTLVNSRTVIVS